VTVIGFCLGKDGGEAHCASKQRTDDPV